MDTKGPDMTIGSGDTTQLLSATTTKGFKSLLQKFVSDDKPYYNALASPIDALRTGAILEDRYALNLGNHYPQVRKRCKEYPCLVSTLDFVELDGGEVVNFIEVKTMWIDDLLTFKDIPLSNYKQVQFQLLCAGLDKAEIHFIPVYTYDDSVNKSRIIDDSEVLKFIVERDKQLIDKIKERASFFQNIADYVRVNRP
jgi:hypothetical protein